MVDPFCGIGTIPLEAALRGRHSYAGDLSPVATIVTSAKVRPASSLEVADLLSELRDFMASQHESDEDDEPEVATFYHERTFEEIRAVRNFLRMARERQLPAADTVTAAMLHLMHGNRPYALSRRSHNIIPIPPKGDATYKPVLRHLEAKLRRHLDPLPATFVRGSVETVAAEQLSTLVPACDAVITSPPFLGSTDFVRQNRIRLWFAGWNYKRQESAKADFYEHSRNRDSTLASIAGVVVSLLRPGGVAVLHLGIVRGYDMAEHLIAAAPEELRKIAVVYEDVRHLESHGRTDRGGTATHAFAVMQRA